MTVFGTLPDGAPVSATQIHAHGLRLRTLSWGASVQDLRLDGTPHPLVLGFPTLAPYLAAEGRYFGAIVGRVANRIAGGTVRLGDRLLHLDRNEAGRTTLHGGAQGSGQRNWRLLAVTADSVSYADTLPHGHMGFPGDLQVQVRYRLRPGPALEILIEARSDQPTLCNFAQHSYFNLDGSDSIRDHILTSPATQYLPVDAHLIPLGPPAPVTGTALDFRLPQRLADRLDGPVIDHNLCLATQRQARPGPVATLAAGGLRMDIESTEPGLQVYVGDHLRPGSTGIGGRPYGRHAGIALEPQAWPDAPHHPDYPSVLLDPGQIYQQSTILHFSPR